MTDEINNRNNGDVPVDQDAENKKREEDQRSDGTATYRQLTEESSKRKKQGKPGGMVA